MGKKRKKAHTKVKSNLPAIKDDGTRWIVVDARDRQVYQGPGLRREDAERLAVGLIQPARLRQVQ